MSEEGNYNMIDGIINNVPKPSMLERMEEYHQKVAEQNQATNERRQEAHQEER